MGIGVNTVRRIAIGVALVLGGLFIWLLSGLVPMSGVMQNLEPKLVGSCSAVDVFAGTEDVAIEYRSNRVFVSAADRRTGLAGDGIYAFPLDGTAPPVRVSPADLPDFHPHGISLWQGESETHLFAISHAKNGEDSVEVFRVGVDGVLIHLQSVAFEAMHSPNDLVAVGPYAFYASNDRGYESGLLSVLEQYFALPLSSAVYFDGKEGRKIAGGIVYANGINRSPDGNTIYIAEVLKRRVSVFDRDVSTGELTRRARIKLNTAPDNIDVDQDGQLWIAGHSQIFKFLAHAGDAKEIAPSHVVKVDPATGHAEDVFVSVDGEINGSSVGAAHDGKLVVGAVFDGHVMVCPLP